jgi:hypothetical protein
MLASGRRISEGPGTFLEEPRAFYMLARHKDAFALPLCPHFAALSSAACGVHEGEPGKLSAVQLPTLRPAGAHLSALRPRQPVLRGGLRADSPARVVAPSG